MNIHNEIPNLSFQTLESLDHDRDGRNFFFPGRNISIL
jgi:hypothetical protein